MHIAHFTNTYYPVISGVVQSVSSFRQALSDLGHNVFVFAQHEPDYEDKEPFIFRYPALDLGLPGDFPATIPISAFVDRLIPSLKVDVIHSHHPVLMGQAAASKAKKLGIPLVFTFHTRYREYSHYIPLSQEFVQGIIQNVIENWLADYLKRCNHVIVPSTSMRQVVINEYGIENTNNLSVVPTGIDLERFKQAEGRSVRKQRGWDDQLVMISVGRLAKEKNWDVLLDAARQVFDEVPNARLAILGDGPDREKLQLLAENLGIARKVDFVGKVPFEEVPAYLKAADLFCFSSVTETQGLATLEALAAGLPVFALKGTGTSDVIRDGQEGRLTESDSLLLSQAILQTLRQPETMARYREAAPRRAAEFEIHRQANKLIEVYQKAIESHQVDEKIIMNPYAM